MALAKSQKSLKDWGKQKWRTKSGKKSSVTGERYLPSAAIKNLSSQEYAATTKAKSFQARKRPCWNLICQCEFFSLSLACTCLM